MCQVRVQEDDSIKPNGYRYRCGIIREGIGVRGLVYALAAFVAIESIAPVKAAMPPRDMSASPWLVSIAPRIYNQARTSMLLRDCADDIHDTLALSSRFNRAVTGLGANDQAYAQRLFLTGGADGNAALQADKTTACRSLAPAARKQIEAINSDRAGFFDPP